MMCDSAFFLSSSSVCVFCFFYFIFLARGKILVKKISGDFFYRFCLHQDLSSSLYLCKIVIPVRVI